MACNMCLIGELAFYRLSDADLWTWLVKHGVVPGSTECPVCHVPCKFYMKDFSFRCWRRRRVRRMVYVTCKFTRRARIGTWFGNSRLTVRKISDFTAMWVSSCYPKFDRLLSNFSFSKRTVVDWSSFCRGVCIEWAINNSQQLGGTGVIVELEEAKFGKRKYNRGRKIVGNWVLGGIQRGSKKCFLKPIADRTRETFFRVIKEKILPGTTIISDCFSSYDTLSSEGFQHFIVNYNMNFVDAKDCSPDTKNRERLWRDVRGAIPRNGRKSKHFAGYLAEYMFRRAYRSKEILHHFFVEAGKLYPPGRNVVQ